MVLVFHGPMPIFFGLGEVGGWCCGINNIIYIWWQNTIECNVCWTVSCIWYDLIQYFLSLDSIFISSFADDIIFASPVVIHSCHMPIISVQNSQISDISLLLSVKKNVLIYLNSSNHSTKKILSLFHDCHITSLLIISHTSSNWVLFYLWGMMKLSNLLFMVL